ncbi:MAG: lamin tail domain-containing protein [Anaerolineaceae bacterium]|nr:lamin tail domain-containing protein [Anaerolineaceae bacterium]
MQSIFNTIDRTINWYLKQFRRSGPRGKVAMGPGMIIGLCVLLISCTFSDPAPESESAAETTDNRSSSEVAEVVESTETPSPTNTPRPTATSEPKPLIEIAVNSANIRSGPGQAYDREGIASGGEQFEVLATDETASWYLIGDNGRTVGWIAASIVTPINPDAINQVTVAATIPASSEVGPTNSPATVPPAPAPTTAVANVPSTATSPPAPTTAATSVPPTATNPPAPQPGEVVIIGVNKQDEFVDLQNTGSSPVDLAGWRLVSEKGNQECPLSGVLQPNATLRVWAMAENSANGGFNCGFGSNIWNNSDSDPAVLYNASGVEVSRR